MVILLRMRDCAFVPPRCRVYQSEFVDCLLDAAFCVRTVWVCAFDLRSADRAARDAGLRCTRWVEVPLGPARPMQAGDVAWQAPGGPVMRSDVVMAVAAARAA